MEEKPYETVNAPPPQPPTPELSAPPAGAGGLSEYQAGAVAYVTVIPAIIFLLIEPYNKIPFVRFHAIQCIGLAVVWFIVNVILGVIPFLGWILIPVATIGFVIILVLTALKALKGEWVKLPFIGDFAMKQVKG